MNMVVQGKPIDQRHRGSVATVIVLVFISCMRGVSGVATVIRRWSCLTLNMLQALRRRGLLGEIEHTPVPELIMKKWSIVAIAAILGVASASFGGAYAAEKLKIGFIYIGPIGDL